MTGEAVLIAAFAGRALAQSARRAGFEPLVVDAFGDEDTREAAEHYDHVPGAVRFGFQSKSLVAALDRLVSSSRRKPIGIVLGSGFEDRTKLIDTLDRRYGLIGTSPPAVRRAKDPATLFPVLADLAIPHPETVLAPPALQPGWLSKRVGASGGGHIRDYGPATKFAARHYFQRKIEGTPISIFAVASEEGIALEFSRQWRSEGVRRPYRYGGAAIVDYRDSDDERHMAETAARLIPAFNLKGLLSFDFLVTEHGPVLLEINPRPGATLDIFDDGQGSLFRAHVEACRAGRLWSDRRLPPAQSRAAAVLYADRGPVIVNAVSWPAWTADRPRPGTQIAAEQPIATVIAEGANDQDAERLARARLSTLSDLVYTSGQVPGQEKSHAARPSPERLEARR